MNTSSKYELNKIKYDEYNRPSGIILLNKPEGISSHDLVDQVRRVLKTQKVGHGGALDIFSSGLMLILIGRATKSADELLMWDKGYKARMILGIKNYTQDPEGEIIEYKEEILPDASIIKQVLESFKGEYMQYVSIYSSVKVNGAKLRKVLRDKRYTFEIEQKGDDEKKIILRSSATKDILKEIIVPKRKVRIYDIKFIESGKVKGFDLPFKNINTEGNYGYIDFYVKCSKGTYVRQLAVDIAEKLGTYATLSQLVRCELGDLTEKDCLIDIDSLDHSAK